MADYKTTLSPEEEARFQEWYAQYAAATGNDPNPDAPEHHYDIRGYWQENPNSEIEPGMHLPDTWKTPGHETFSVESKYWDGDLASAGHWEGGVFVKPDKGTSEQPKFSGYEDMYKSFHQDPTKDMTAAAHEARQYTALFAMADAMSHMANMIGTAHGAEPMQLSSATEEHDARYQQLMDSLQKRRDAYDKGIMDVRMQDYAEKIRREERERQEIAQAERIRQEQEFRAQQTQAQQQHQAEMQQAQQQFQAQQQTERIQANATSDAAAQAAKEQKENEKIENAKKESEDNANAYMESFFDSRNIADYNAAMKINPTVARAALKKWNQEHPDDQISLRGDQDVDTATRLKITEALKKYQKKRNKKDYDEAVALNAEYTQKVMNQLGLTPPDEAAAKQAAPAPASTPAPAPATTSADTTRSGMIGTRVKPVINVDEFNKYEF